METAMPRNDENKAERELYAGLIEVGYMAATMHVHEGRLIEDDDELSAFALRVVDGQEEKHREAMAKNLARFEEEIDRLVEKYLHLPEDA